MINQAKRRELERERNQLDVRIARTARQLDQINAAIALQAKEEAVPVVGYNHTGKAEGDAVPRVAVQTHKDGDPKPRPSEIANWNQVRKEQGMPDFLCQILVEDKTVTDGPFPGYTPHWWRLFERDGQPVVEPTEVDMTIVPDGDALTDPTGQSLLHKQRRIYIQQDDPDPDGYVGAAIGQHLDRGLYFVYWGESGEALDAVRTALVEAEAELRPPTTAKVYDKPGESYDWDEVQRMLTENDRDQFGFRVTREITDDRTFSAVAMEGLARQILAFVMSRCQAYWGEHHEPPRDLTLYVDLRLDHDTP